MRFYVLALALACSVTPTADDAGADAVVADASASAAIFSSRMFFAEDARAMEVHRDSADMLSALRTAGGFGNGDHFQVDFSIEVLRAEAATPKRNFEATGDFFEPDCDQMPIPIPSAGALEGETGLRCTTGGDCHLIVVAPWENRLYEMWRADINGTEFRGGCLAVWDTAREYGRDLRGNQCTSADAAGFPIAPLLFNADEVAAGRIAHAVRFILPNDRIRPSTFVAPATHGTRTTGAANALPYGAHLRLRADYPLASLPNDAARVVARALQEFGMYHADGGQIALTAQSDRFTAHKWSEVGFGPQDLSSLRVEDFEVLDHGPSVEVTFDCVRSPL